MQKQLAFTRFLNTHFAAPVDRVLAAVHVTPVHPHAPVTNFVAMELLVFVGLLAWFVLIRTSLSVERPNTVQTFAEWTHEFVDSQSYSILGHGNERYITYLTVLLLFILIGNLMGLVPGLESPTGYLSVPLGFALMTFVYYHYHGIRTNRFGYVKQFLGPVWWLYPLMLPIEIISHFARILSLTVRLTVNMFAGDLVTMVFFSLIPIGLPVIFLGLHVFVSLVQAYIFMILTIVYLSMATSHDH
jgi:F-type H+-transporting ATPase subunit a